MLIRFNESKDEATLIMPLRELERIVCGLKLDWNAREQWELWCAQRGYDKSAMEEEAKANRSYDMMRAILGEIAKHGITMEVEQ